MRNPIPRISLVAALLGLSASACSSGGAPSCEQPVTTDSVEIGEFFYEPGCVETEQASTLTIDNTGAVPHTFTVADTAASLDVAGGESGELDLTGVAPGLYRVICTYHPEMEAALQVT